MVNDDDSVLDATAFSEAVQGLLMDLEAFGICLVHVAARPLPCAADTSEAVHKAVERFARINRLDPFGKERLHHHLVTHVR